MGGAFLYSGHPVKDDFTYIGPLQWRYYSRVPYSLISSDSADFMWGINGNFSMIV